MASERGPGLLARITQLGVGARSERVAVFMAMLLCVVLPGAAAPVAAQTQTLVWETQHANGTIPGPVTLGGTTVTVNGGTPTGGVALANHNTVQYGTRGAHAGYYYIGFDGTASGQLIRTSLDFSRPVDSLSFDLLDIDLSSWHDSVSVRGYNGTTAFTPVITLAVGATPIVTAPGEITSTANHGNGSAGGNATLLFTQPTDSIVITYFAGPRVASPNGQVLGIADMTWTIVRADLATTKTAPDTVQIGDTFTYVVTTTNNGPDPADSVVVVDTLPVGVSFVSANRSGVHSSGVVTWPRLTSLASGASQVDSVTVVALASGSLINTAASQTPFTTDSVPGNNSGSHTVVVTPAADLDILKTGPPSVDAGDTVTYSLRVTNLGPSTATNVVISDTLPTTGTFVSASNSGSESAGVLTWPTLASMTTADTVTYTVTFVAPATGSMTNRGAVAGVITDPVVDNDTSSVTTAVTELADLNMTKSGPTSVDAGDTVTYSVSVTNLGPSNATNVTITDSLPTTGTFVSASDGGVHASGVITWPNVATMTPSDTVTYTVVLVAPPTGTLTNVAAASTATTDPTSGNDVDSVSTTVSELADLDVLKSGPAVVNAGDTITYSIRVTNLGPSDASTVVITDTLPATGGFVSASSGGTHVAGVVTWPTLGTMTPSDTVTYTVTFVAPVTGSLNNVAAATTTTTDPATGNNTSSVTTNVTEQADLAILKTGPASANAGDTITYTIRVTNAGPSHAGSVDVVDSLPTTGTFVSATGGGVETSGVIAWPSIPSVTPADTITYTVTFVAPVTGTLANVAVVTAGTADPLPGNNTSSVTTSVTEQADLEIVKSGPAAVDAGDTIVYSVRVTNLGPSDAASVVITDTLPSSGTFVSASNGGAESGGVVTWPTLATVTPADTVTYAVTFVAPATGSLDNVAVVATATADPNGANNTSSVSTSVSELADLDVLKTGPATADAGDTITYTIRVTNLGPSDGATVVVTDTLPSSGTFVTASAGGAHSAGVVTWPTIANMTPADTVTYTVTFVAPATGVLSNVAVAELATADPNTSNNSSTVGTSITEIADLSVTKTGPTGALAFDTIDYVITTTSLGPSTAANVVVTDTLPSGALFVSATGGGTHSGGVVTWSLGSLPSGSTVVDTVRVSVPGNATYVNVVAGTSTTTDPDPSNNNGSSSSARVTTVVPPAAADLVVTKTGPTSVNANDTIVYGIKVVNNGPNGAQTVVVTDTLPATGTFVSVSGSGSETGGVITWPTVINLAANDSVQYTVTYVVPTTGTIVNTAAATSTTTDTIPGGETSTVTTTVTEQADLDVLKTGPASVNAGDTIMYSVRVTNLGPSDASSVVITDTLPATGAFVSASNGGAESGGVVTWPTLGTMTPSDTVTYTVTFVAPNGGSIDNTAAASSSTADPTPGNNTSSVSTSVAPQADLDVLKTGPASVNAGDTITYSVRVTNLGPSDATTVIVTDTLPVSGTLVGVSGGGVESGGVVTWPTVGTMTPADTLTFTVTWVAPGSGSLTNVAAATSSVTDPVPGNNTSTVSTSVSEQSDLDVLKTGPAVVDAGDTVVYTIRVTTLGVSDAANVVITDTLPSNGTFVGASHGGTATGGVVTWPTIASMTTADTVTYSVTVVAPGTGTMNNVAAATSSTTDPSTGNNTSGVSTTVNEQADLEIVKTGPATVVAADTIVYSLQVTNLGVSDASSVVITDTLPTAGTFVSASNGGVESSGVVTWPTLATMTPADTVTYAVTFVAPTSGSLTNTAAVSSAITDPVTSNNTSSVATSVTEQSDVEVVKAGPASANAGDTITYSVRVTTLGPSNAANVVITDTLPTSGTFVSASNGGTEVGGTVTWPTIGSMTVADTVTYTVTFVAPGSGSLSNTAAATTTTTDPNASNNSSTVGTGVSAQADLEIVKTGPASANAGDTITYSVRVTNLGVSDAASVVIADTLPATGTFVGASNSGVEAGGVVTWPTVPTMTPADTVTYTVDFAVPASGSVMNTATVASGTADPVTGNNLSQVSTSVSERADMEVVKTGPASVDAADTVVYSVRVTNLGPSDADNVVVTDTLPASGSFVSASNGGTESSGVVTWPTIATMTPADTVTYTVTWVAPTTGSLTNVAAAATTTTDPNAANNSSSVATSVAEMADLEVTKTGPAAVSAADTVDYTIQVTNLGVSDASSVVITDTLPGAGTLVSASNGGVESGGVVTWPTVATMTTADTVAYTVRWVAPASGSLTNVGAASTSTADPDGGNNRSQVVTTVAAVADLEVTKTGPAAANAADTVVYAIQVTNLGPSDAATVIVTDTLPSTGTFVSASNGGVEAGGVVTWATIGTMTTADTVAYTVTFVAPTTGSIDNVAAATTATTESTSANNVSAVATTISEVADLRVTKTGPVGASQGDSIEYVVTTTNLGPSAATAVVVTDTLPAGALFVSATGGGTHSGGVVTWNLGSLMSGSTVVDTVRVGLPANAVYLNIAAGTSSTSDPDPTNNNGSAPSARVTTNVPAAAADLSVVKTGPASITTADTVTYSITVTNSGPNNAQNVRVTDTLPASGTFVSASGGGSATGGVVAWPLIGSVTPADTLTYTVRWVAPASGSLTNLAAVTSPTADTVPGNNTSSVVTTVDELTDVVVGVTGPATANAADTIVYTLTVTNNGPSDAAGVIVTDTLPGGGTFVSATGGGTESGGVVTWPTIGSVTPADTVTYTVTYVVPAMGSITNTAAVTTTTTESTTANNRATTATTISAMADLEAVKTGPAAANAGDTITYTVRVTNLGASDATNVVITDTLPATGAFVSASDGGTETGGVITWPTIGTMTPADTVSYTVAYVAPVSGSITNIVAATSDVTDPVPTNNDGSGSGRVTTTISELTDVAVAISGPTSGNAGDTVVYTLTVTNNGPSHAAGVVVADSLPGTGTFVSATGGGTESGGTVTWPVIATVTPADTLVYTVAYVLPPTGTVTSTATVATTTTESTTANNVDPISTVVTPQADLEAVKTGPATANAGDTITYSVRVTNLGPSDASSAVITDTLPSSGTFISATGGGTESTGVITWPTVGSMTTADTVTYTVTFVAPASGSITNIVAATSSTADPENSNNDGTGPGRVTTTITSVSDAAVTITGPATANAGDTVVYTLTVTNNGPSDAANVVVVDSLPATGTFVSATGGGSESGGVVTWPTLPTVTPADTLVYTLTYVVPPTGTATHTATVGTSTTESTTANNVDAVSTVVTEQADLEAIKTGPATATAGDTIAYTVRITNLGASDATNVVVTDTLPSTGTFVSASDGGTQSGGVITWPVIGTMTPADTVAYSVVYVAPAGGAITNVVAAESPTGDPDPSNNNGSGAGRVTTTVAALTDVAVTIAAPATANAGDTITYTVTVTNNGPSDAASVVVADSLPATGTFVSASSGGVESGGTVTWPSIATVTPADTVVYSVTYVVPPSGSITSTATVATATSESTSANNVDAATTTVSAQADLEILKTAPATGQSQDTVVFTIRVVNLGPSAASNVVVTDTLPATDTLDISGQFVGASNGGTEAAGVVTWPTIGTMLTGDTITYTVSYQLPNSGPITNRAGVTSSPPDPSPSNNADQATIAVTPVTDLAVTKSGPATALPGDTLEYVVTSTNTGFNDAAGVVVTDTLPGGTVFVDATGGGTEAAGVVTWSVGTLARLATRSDTVRVSVPTTGSYTNIAAGSTTTPDVSATNNDGSASNARVTTVVTALAADLDTDKTGPASITAGDTVVYDIKVVNRGPDAAQNVIVTDSLPSTGTFISATNGGAEAAGVVTWPTVATIAANDSVQYTVRLLAPASGTLTNVATATSSTGDTVPGNEADTVVTTVVPLADVAVDIAGPANATAGDTVVYTVTVTNNGPSDAANVVIADSLPAAGTFVSASNGGTEASGTVTWPTVATVTPSDTLVYTVTYVVPATGPVTHTATVATPTNESTTANNVDAQATAVSTAAADLETTKSGPASVVAGDTVTYGVKVVNRGPDAAQNVVVTDTLPGSGTFVDASDSGTEATGVVTWPTVTTLAANDSVQYSVRILAPATGTLTNIAAASSPTADTVPGNEADTVTTTVTELADPAINIAGPATAMPGDTVVYTLTITNNGPSAAANVVVADSLPATGTFVSASNGGTETGGTVTWPTIGAVTPGDTIVYTVTFVVPATGTITSTATVATTTSESATANNADAVSTTVSTLSADLRTTKAGPASVTAGDTVAYTIKVVNHGPDAAQNVDVADTLPGSATFVSASSGGTETAGVVTWPTTTSLASNDSVQYTVRVLAPASGALTNVATATATTPDGVPGNEADTVTTTVTPLTDVAIDIAGPTAVLGGDTIVHTITVTNNGPSDASSVVIADSLPATVTFVSASGGGTESGGTVTWPTIGSVTPADTLVYTVTVVAPASGTLTSTATAATPTTESTTANNVDAVTTTVSSSAADLVTTKTGPATVVAGDTVTYGIKVVNRGPDAAQSVAVTDTLPGNAAFVSASNGATEAAGVVTWPTVVSLAANDSVQYTVRLLAPGSGTLTNVAAVASLTADTVPGNEVDTVTTTVTPLTDVAVDIAGPASTNPGDTIVYTVTVTNNGPSDAASVVIADSLPPTGTFVSASNGGTESGGTVTWPTIANVTPADTIVYTVTFVVPASGSVTSTATVTTPTTESTTVNNVDAVTTTVANQADVEVVKSGPAAVSAGDTIAYTIRITNNGPSNAASVVVTDTLPATGTFVAASNGATEAGGVVTWPTIATVTPADTLTYTVTFEAPSGGTLTNIAASTSPTPDPDGSNNNGTGAGRVVTVVGSPPAADLEVTKTGPATANASDTITYGIKVVNRGPDAASAVVVTDTLPPAGTFVGATGGGVEASGVVTWPTIGTLAANDSVSFNVQFEVPATGTVVNVARATAGTIDTVPGNNRSAVSTTIGGAPSQADLRVLKSGPSSASPGDTLTYAIQVTNDGPATGMSVVVTDQLPTGLTFVSASGGGTLSGNTVTWPTIGSLANGANATYNVRAVATGVGTFVNLASASSITTDPTISNNDGTSSASRVTTVVTAGADLSIVKSGPASAMPGDTVDYVLTVENAGPSAAADVLVTDSLPSGLIYVGSSDSGVLTGRVVTWPTVPTLASGDRLTRTVRVVGFDVGVRTNVARVASTTADADPTNNRDVAVTAVTASPDLSIDKAHSGSFAVGQRATYQISISNVGQGQTTGPITVVDTLPTGLTFVSGNGPGWSFSQAGGVITATRSQTLAAGGTTTFALTVDVAAAATPTVTNWAHVSTPGDGVPGNDSDEDTTDVGLVDLSILKTAVGEFNVGEAGTFSFTITNTGTAPNIGAVIVVDTLPAGLTYSGIDGVGWSASHTAGVVTAVYNGTLTPGSSTIFTMTVNVGPLATGAMTNRATVSTDGDPGDTDTASFDVATGSELVIEKSSSQAEVEVGDVVDYSLVVSVVGTSAVPDVSIIDDLPLGFRYEPGTSRRDGQPIPDPIGGVGPKLTWQIGLLPQGGKVTITYRVYVGPESTRSDGINTATALSPSTGKRSNVALAAVRLRPGAFTDEGTILGKVYVECGCEIDGQDFEELGIPGVRVVLQDGTSAVTDVEGKYHFFGLSPRNWVVKVDPASLPQGARLVPLTNRHGNDGSTVLVDLKSGELARADFADGSRSPDVTDEVKLRREAGEVASLLLDPTAPEQVAAQRAVSQPHGAQLFRSIVSRSPNSINTRNSNLPGRAGEVSLLVDSTALSDTEAPASSIELERPGGLFTADGVTTVPFTIRASGGAGNATVTLEATNGRWLSVDVDPVAPGTQISLVGGQAEALLQAPAASGRVEVRVSLDDERPTRDALFFQPRGHDMIAVGLLEARLEMRSLDVSDMFAGSTRNRFEDELLSLSVSSDSENVTAGTRASLFAQGRVSDDLNLTLRLDTEEDGRSRLFRDIRPDEFYPVYGDAGVQAFDAQSKGRFFGRLDRGASYLQYGDFSTSTVGYGQLGARELGRYSRTLNGLFQHTESERYAFNAFASRDRFMQVVDELRGQGISGPYQLSRKEGLVNSERVELVTRDRNQPAVILAVQTLERYTDYTIEPFSGRLIFKRPIPSVDPELNPVAIRVTYEVETGGDAFWVYGADGQFRATDRLEVGGGYVRDDNGVSPFDLASVNGTVALSDNTFLVGEWARSDSADATTGSAQRLELRHSTGRFDGRVFYLNSDSTFQNPSAAFGSGRNEIGFKGYARLDDRTALFGEGLRTENLTNGGIRRGWSAGVERAFGEWLRGRLGYRWADETATPATAATSQPGATPSETNAISARLTGRLFSDGSVFGEFEQDVAEATQRRLAVGGDYRLLGRARLYGRHEFITSLAGPYALNAEQEQNTTVFGIAADILPGQSVFSEYRMRDAVAGREAQAAVGLRNQWQIREGMRLSSSFERLSPLTGETSSATAVTGGIEYTANPLWRASARAEYRAADSGNNLFGSVGYARKLSRDWTLLGNSVFSTVVDGNKAFERTRLGVAYRETDQNRWNALARWEHRYDRNPDLSETTTTRMANILAGHVNYQPNLALILRGQWASKWASETSGGFDTKTQAHLAGARATLDVTDRWDVGAVGRVLMAGAFESAQWGLGGEVGVLLKDDLRLAAGYNVFGFDDGDLSSIDQTDHGFYVQIGFKFDEGLFWDRKPEAERPDSVVTRWSRPLPVFEPNERVQAVRVAPIQRDTLYGVQARITDEIATEDLRLIDHWMERAVAAADTTAPQGRYGVARALALAGVAKTELTDNDQTGFAESLVREVKRTVMALEASSQPVLPEPAAEGSTRVAEDLWELAAQAKRSEAFACVADRVARLEAMLLWAGNEDLTCSIDDPRPHLERARAMAVNLRTEQRICLQPPPDPPAPTPTLSETALVVPNVVHFAFDRSSLDSASRAVLDSVAAVLEAHPTVRILVHGHTDVRGSTAYNDALGGRRADQVLDYLASRGVDTSRMRALSRGEAETYRSASDERDHALNRRVEIRFLSDDGTEIQTRRQERDVKPRPPGSSALLEGDTPNGRRPR